MYKDFEDLRDNCPVEIKAEIAIDFLHDDAERLAVAFESTSDGEFRLSLNQAIADFWEQALREKMGDGFPENAFAIIILFDSYKDPEMGYSLFLELHAYCGTEDMGDKTWALFDDAAMEQEYEKLVAEKAPEFLFRIARVPGMGCTTEIMEIEEL
jgi:hypothetical protein